MLQRLLAAKSIASQSIPFILHENIFIAKEMLRENIYPSKPGGQYRIYTERAPISTAIGQGEVNQ